MSLFVWSSVVAIMKINEIYTSYKNYKMSRVDAISNDKSLNSNSNEEFMSYL